MHSIITAFTEPIYFEGLGVILMVHLKALRLTTDFTLLRGYETPGGQGAAGLLPRLSFFPVGAVVLLLTGPNTLFVLFVILVLVFRDPSTMPRFMSRTPDSVIGVQARLAIKGMPIFGLPILVECV